MCQRCSPPWNPCYRLIPSRFPPVSLFERVADADAFDTIFAVQALVNPRVRQALGEIGLVPRDQRVFGPGSTAVMAAFCHLSPDGSRFSDGSWGVYYGAQTLETAVAEVSHHRSQFLAATRQPAIELDMRCYIATVQSPLHDLRGVDSVHAPDSYEASRRWARELREQGAAGLLYRSVRDPGQECVAVLRPNAVRIPVIQGPHITLRWDGIAIRAWYRKSDVHDV